MRLGTCAAAALRTLKELSVWLASPVCDARGHPSTSTFKEFVQSTVSPAAKVRIDSAWASMGTNGHAARALRMLSSEVWCQSVMTSSQSAPSVIPMVLFHQRKAKVARVQGRMRRGACFVPYVSQTHPPGGGGPGRYGCPGVTDAFLRSLVPECYDIIAECSVGNSNGTVSSAEGQSGPSSGSYAARRMFCAICVPDSSAWRRWARALRMPGRYGCFPQKSGARVL